MASSSKKKTTMAKMNREAAVRERRLRKQAKKDARKLAALEPQPVESDESPESPESPETDTVEEPVGEVRSA